MTRRMELCIAGNQELALQCKNVIFGGRLGKYIYADMDDTVVGIGIMGKRM